MSVTSVRINHELEPLIEQFTHENRRTKNWVINEALRIFFESKQIQEQRWQGTLRGLNDIKTGEVVDGAVIDAWLASWGSNNEQGTP